MRRDTLIEEMMELTHSASFITKSQLCRYLGITPKTAKKYLEGLQPFRDRYYHIDDVADAIIGGRCADE